MPPQDRRHTVHEPASATPTTKGSRLKMEADDLARQARVAAGAADIAQNLFYDEDERVRDFLTTWEALVDIAGDDTSLLTEMLVKLRGVYGR